jgi:hypothetical protein
VKIDFYTIKRCLTSACTCVTPTADRICAGMVSKHLRDRLPLPKSLGPSLSNSISKHTCYRCVEVCRMMNDESANNIIIPHRSPSGVCQNVRDEGRIEGEG